MNGIMAQNQQLTHVIQEFQPIELGHKLGSLQQKSDGSKTTENPLYFFATQGNGMVIWLKSHYLPVDYSHI